MKAVVFKGILNKSHKKIEVRFENLIQFINFLNECSNRITLKRRRKFLLLFIAPELNDTIIKYTEVKLISGSGFIKIRVF